MATATKKSRASKQLAERRADVHPQAVLEFHISEDNSGSYHWTIFAGDGSTLGGSGGYVSYNDAERAVQQIRDGAGSARLPGKNAL
jgi:uncharacterized protein YegP (UPF0339 family)